MVRLLEGSKKTGPMVGCSGAVLDEEIVGPKTGGAPRLEVVVVRVNRQPPAPPRDCGSAEAAEGPRARHRHPERREGERQTRSPSSRHEGDTCHPNPRSPDSGRYPPVPRIGRMARVGDPTTRWGAQAGRGYGTRPHVVGVSASATPQDSSGGGRSSVPKSSAR